MADEEQGFDEGIAGEQDLSVGSQKTGFLPGIVMKILKWAAIAIAAVIFIVTVVVITMNIMGRGSETQTRVVSTSEDYNKPQPIMDYYRAIEEIRGRTADENPATVMVKVDLGYEQGNKTIQSELVQRTPQLRDLIRHFFSSKTVDDLRPENEEQLKMELKEKINDILKEDITMVLFQDFNVVAF